MYPLYIDPGTGSMLFSLFIGLAAAGYFLFRTLLLKLKYMLSGGKTSGKETRHPFVIYNESLQYHAVFKPVLDEFEKRTIPVLYLSSAENDPAFSQSYDYVKAEYIGSGNRAFARLNFLEADVCLMTTPGLEVYQLKRSKGVRHYAHILHDTGDVTCYRLFGIDWFDSILLSAEYQIGDIRELETIRQTQRKDLVVVGSTYLDVYREKLQNMECNNDHPFTVLVSPSWGPGSLLKVFGEKLLDPLSQTGWRIVVRPHPQSKKTENEMLLKLEEKYKTCPNIEWDYSPQNITTLSCSDVMISDFSSIIFDYICLLKRPVLYTNAFFNKEMYDAGDLDHLPWKFEAVKEFGRELTTDDLPGIEGIIKKTFEDKTLLSALEAAGAKAWENRGKSGASAVDFLVSVKDRTGTC